MLVRVTSRFDDSPSIVIACSSCSDAKSTRPPASGIHNWTLLCDPGPRKLAIGSGSSSSADHNLKNCRRARCSMQAEASPCPASSHSLHRWTSSAITCSHPPAGTVRAEGLLTGNKGHPLTLVAGAGGSGGRRGRGCRRCWACTTGGVCPR
jgi:hypothetical protein